MSRLDERKINDNLTENKIYSRGRGYWKFSIKSLRSFSGSEINDVDNNIFLTQIIFGVVKHGADYRVVDLIQLLEHKLES